LPVSDCQGARDRPRWCRRVTFTACDFIAEITQHILDKSSPARALLRVEFQQDARPAGKQANEEVQTDGDAVEVIDVSTYQSLLKGRSS
jgi:hypothetical protein